MTNAIIRLLPQFIRLPQTDEEKNSTQQRFFSLDSFPRVIGAIDCTHIKIISPGGENAENFRNRKGVFSLNVQAVCNANYEITDIVARWPGASHDSHIFDNSLLRMRFENNELGNGILLGDSGYPVRHYLITPLNNPHTPAEILFNESHIRTRNIIEKTFGIWKRRFPVLSLGIRCKMELCQKIIVATAILHNICRLRNEEVPEEHYIEEEMYEDIHINNENDNDAVRRELIDYFQTLL